MSHVIRVARVTCIFLMMYTHARPYPAFEHWPHQAHNIILHIFYAIPGLMLGKASVPLLGAVSGWLFAHTFRGDWLDNVRKKARSVLLPLLLWNALLLVIFMALPALEPRWKRPDTLLGWLDKFVPLIEYPTNSPLYFLRDLFICMVVAPLLLTWFDAKGRAGMAWALGLSCLYASAAGEYAGLTRPVILPTFVAGLVLARLGLDVLARSFFQPKLLAVSAAFAVVALCVAVPITGTRLIWWPVLGHAPEVLDRFALAYVLWWGVVALARAPFGRVVAQIEPYIFFVFCTHHIVGIFAWALFGDMFRYGPFSPVYPFYFVALPVLAMLVGIAGYRLMAEFAPRTLGVLTGGRVAAGLGRRRWAVA